MSRRYIYASRGEHIVVHRSGSSNAGCGILILGFIVFGLIAAHPALALFSVAVIVVIFMLKD